MKAIVVFQNSPLQPKWIARMTDVPTPTPENVPEGYVLVKCKAIALNHRDLYILNDQYPGISEGSIMGADGAGVVVYPECHKGRRVLIQPCVGWESQETCPEEIGEYGLLGLLPQTGTFCECIMIEEKHVHDAPPHLSFSQLASIPLAGLTAYRAATTLGKVGPGMNVLIPGIGGGVATWLLQFVLALGANAYVTSSSQQKLQQALDLGAKAGFLYTQDNWVSEAQTSAGWFDVVIDGASGPYVKQYIRLLRPGGRLVIYGAVAGSNVTLNAPYLWFKHITILGASMGNAKEFKDMLQLIAKTQMEPIVSKTFSGLESFDQAMAFLR